MPVFARLNAGVVRIGRHLAKRRNIMWRLQFDLSREQNSPDQPGKRVQNGRSATPLIVISRFELPLLGSNQDSPDPEREKSYAAATYKTYTNREIVSSVCCESPRSMSELVRVCSTQVTSQPS